ncbi:MAG TPA: hypothetical protein VMS77_03670 [Conexivisphaerales archaeon]|nr:hypothetical protein [Conexivisphaerales archaeon]
MSDVTIAASASAFKQLFNALIDNFTFSKSDSASYGPFSASYSVALHLEDGTLSLHDDGTIEIQDVDIVWDTLKASACFDLPGFCVGGWCIVPDPWNGCLVGIPKICIGGPICIPVDLSGLVSEITDVKASLLAKYYVDPARPANVTDLAAEFAGHPNKWQVYIDPVWVHVDPINVPDTLENIIENIIKNAIYNMLGPLPDWMKDILWAAIQAIGILDIIKGVLGIVGSIADWFENLFNSVFDLVGLVETAVADYFANKYPIYEFEDPYPILPASGGLIPVKIPIRNLAATINSHEMIVTADVGA